MAMAASPLLAYPKSLADWLLVQTINPWEQVTFIAALPIAAVALGILEYRKSRALAARLLALRRSCEPEA